MAVKPIRPDQIAEAKEKVLPDAVLAIFNEEIARAWNGTYAQVQQTIVESRIAAALCVSGQEVIDRGYLDVEDVYRAAGWKVIYDKPGYCESYPAHFRFSKS